MRWPGRCGLALSAAVVLAAFAPTDSPASTAVPLLGQSAVISRVGGRVAFKGPSSSRFVALGSAPQDGALRDNR